MAEGINRGSDGESRQLVRTKGGLGDENAGEPGENHPGPRDSYGPREPYPGFEPLLQRNNTSSCSLRSEARALVLIQSNEQS